MNQELHERSAVVLDHQNARRDLCDSLAACETLLDDRALRNIQGNAHVHMHVPGS